jgi:hypothetical protein
VADEQQASVGLHTGQLDERSAGVEAGGQRRMHRKQSTLLLTPVLSSQLGCLARARLGAEQHRVKARPHLRQRDPGDVRLTFTALGQTTLGIHARTVRLCISMT